MCRGRGPKKGDEDIRYHSQTEWSIRLPLVKDGVEWGWLNFYHGLDGEALLVDMNYLSDLLQARVY